MVDLLRNLIKNISPADTMCDNGAAKYFEVGSIALSLCKRIIGSKIPDIIVDFPSGYGRGLRWFRAEWPQAEIFAVETDARMLDFVEQTFGAKRVQADPYLKATQLPSNVDLIFTGSLLTHFDDFQWDQFLELCLGALKVGGTLVFTVHGRLNALMLKNDPNAYSDLIDGRALYEKYARTGFAYQPYATDYPEFGVSLSSPAWVFKKIQAIGFCKIIYFEESGWGQDVVAIEKLGASII